MTTEQKLREAFERLANIVDRFLIPSLRTLDAEGIKTGQPERDELYAAQSHARQALALPTAEPVGERESFEQFAQNCPMGKYSVTRRGEGYDSSHTQIMWDAWQARAALAGDAAVLAEREACAALENEPGVYTKHDMAAAIRQRGAA